MLNVLTEERPLSKSAVAKSCCPAHNSVMFARNACGKCDHCLCNLKETTIDVNYSNPNIETQHEDAHDCIEVFFFFLDKYITEHLSFCFDSEIQHPVNRRPCMLHCGLAGKALQHDMSVWKKQGSMFMR